MDFHLHFQILRGRVKGFFFKLGSKFFCQMACIYLLNSRGGPQSFDFDITYFIYNYSYPLLLRPFSRKSWIGGGLVNPFLL